MDGVEEEESVECKAMSHCGVTSDLLSEVKTMRLEGKLMGIAVLVSVDSGASNNFIYPHVTAVLELPVTVTRELGIQLGEDHNVPTSGKCTNIGIQFGDIEINVDACVLDLGSLDVMLGLYWLNELGKVVMDRGEMTMKFLHQGEPVQLRGQIPNFVILQGRQEHTFDSTSFNRLLKEVHNEDWGKSSKMKLNLIEMLNN